MSNEVTAQRDQDNEAFGAFLLQTIADLYDCEPTPSMISRCVYKYTDCGAYIHFDDKGIIVGTIVEGSDAEFTRYLDLTGIDTDDDGAELVRERFYDALDACEEFAIEEWCAVHDDYPEGF